MRTRCSYRSRVAASLAALLFVGLGPAAHAVDGVIEINQAKVQQGGITSGDTAGSGG